jgi:hypothetical protein
MTDSTTPDDDIALPGAVERYLKAHNEHDTAAASAELTPDVTVVDEGRTYRGVPAVEQWLDTAASEYTYTTTFLGSERHSPDRFTVTQRLEGDFPGGIVDLHYRFTLSGERISGLVIEP